MKGWGMFPKPAAMVAAYVWLGLAVWVLAAPNNSAPSLVKAVCGGCWLAVGLWVWERLDVVGADRGRGLAAVCGLLLESGFTVVFGVVAVCCAGPLAGVRWLRGRALMVRTGSNIERRNERA